ncbi:MAG: hypothetical protein ACRDTF_24880 [Pseudonocardiaceae bacterium]
MTTQPNFDTMTDAELANYHYTHRDSPLGDEADLENVEVEIAHPLHRADWSGGVGQVNP